MSLISSQAFESPIEAVFAADLLELRPELRYRDELPGAREAVLDRLWRGLSLDPLPRSPASRTATGTRSRSTTDGS